MRIGLQAPGCWDAFPDGDHSSPFREACPESTIFGQTIPQAIEPFGDGFTWEAGQSYSTLINLDTRDDTTLFQQGRERGAILGLLTYRE